MFKKKKLNKDRTDYIAYKHFYEVYAPDIEKLSNIREQIVYDIGEGEKSFKKYEKLKQINKEIFMLKIKMEECNKKHKKGYLRYKEKIGDDIDE